jgi:apoptosis-inducing factor 2
MGQKRRVLVVGGGFSGLLCARDLAGSFDVTVVDAKEFFEYTPGTERIKLIESELANNAG